jgi:hypothetical protein
MRKSDAVIVEGIRRAVRLYRDEAELERLPAITKRQASRALQRLRRACREVERAVHGLPDGLDNLYAGALLREAAVIESEVALRLHGLAAGKGRRPSRFASGPVHAARRRFEAHVANLYVQNGGRISTYDPDVMSSLVVARGSEAVGSRPYFSPPTTLPGFQPLQT